MRIQRFFSKPGVSPYLAFDWRETSSEIRNPDGSIVYIHIITPVVKDADYSIMNNIYAGVKDPGEQKTVFDLYRGEQVGEGRKSLALRLEFRAPDRTLTDEDVAQRREKIVAALGEQVGGELRA